MISWQDMQFLKARKLGPDLLGPGCAPRNYPDIAPFPLWLVPPAWRCARISDITGAIARWQEQQQERAQLPITLQMLPQWFERRGEHRAGALACI